MSPSYGYRALLATYLLPQWRSVLALAALVAASIALQLAGPSVLRLFIDEAAARAPLSRLAEVALLFLGLAIVLQVARVAEVFVAERVGLVATNRMRVDLTLHVLRLDPPFHAAHPPGELIERTDGDVGTLGSFFSRLVVQIVGNAILLLGALGLLIAVDPRIGLAVGACAFLGLGIVLGLRHIAVPRYGAQRQAFADLYGLIEERLTGAEDLRANGGIPYTLRRLAERSRAVVWAGVRAQIAGGAGYTGMSLCLNLATVAGLAGAALLYREGALTIGAVYVVYAYAQALRQPLEGVGRHLQELQQAVASIGRIRSVLAERSAVATSERSLHAPRSLPAGPLGLDFERVRFAYGDADLVLDDVTFRLQPGEVLGLLGRTGSGKTTITRLLFRLYDPTAGTVRLGGTDLRDLPLAAVRSRVALVTQEVQLFHASIRDNVTLFDATVPDDRVRAVLSEVGLEEWLATQNDGIHTVLPPGGGGLSAGESQLLAFARAFLADPGLIVLDEASSRLDPSTERMLERAVDRLLAGRTAIVIAHRLETVRRADAIVILEGGRIVEAGDRAALAADATTRLSRLLRVGQGADEVLA